MKNILKKVGKISTVILMVTVTGLNTDAQTNNFFLSNPISNFHFIKKEDVLLSNKNVGKEKSGSSKKSSAFPAHEKYPSLFEAFFSCEKTNESNPLQPRAYAYRDLAFFCKVEVQIEKAAKIPFKFRLGDVRYVDYLEQKIDSPE